MAELGGQGMVNETDMGGMCASPRLLILARLWQEQLQHFSWRSGEEEEMGMELALLHGKGCF